MCTLSSYLLQHLYAVRALHLLIVIMQGNIKPHMKYEKMSYEIYIYIYIYRHLKECVLCVNLYSLPQPIMIQ